jgi:hypothetical protein
VASLVADWLQDVELKRLLQASVKWHQARLISLRETPWYREQMIALARAAEVTYSALDQLLFVQPLAPAGKRMVADLQARGVPDSEIAAQLARAVAGLEAARDAREEAELRKIGVVSRNS